MSLLGIDLGTTNVKAVVADARGRFLGQGAHRVGLYPLSGGGVEQDLGEIDHAMVSAIRQATAQAGDHAVEAVGVSSQGGALQVFDAAGRPVGRVISWLDARGGAQDEAFTAEMGGAWFAERIGHGGSGLAIGQILRLHEQGQGVQRVPPRIGFVGDAMVQSLCGRPVQDATSGCLTLLYNPSRRTYDPDLLKRLWLEPSQLPALGDPERMAGRLTDAAAERAGLRAGIPVSVAIHDQYAAALGMGATRAGDVMFGAGTAWVLLAVFPGLTAPVTPRAYVGHHVVPSVSGQILSLHNGGSAVAWAASLTGMDKPAGANLDSVLNRIAPGADGLQFRPFLAGTSPDGVPIGTRGCLSGLQLVHTPGHVLRAVIEGLAFELDRHLGFIGRAGLGVRRLIMGGGAAASEVTPRIVASVTGLPVDCATTVEASLLGAVILARRLVEPTGTLRELSAEMVPAPRTIEPDPAGAVYRDLSASYRASLPPA